MSSLGDRFRYLFGSAKNLAMREYSNALKSLGVTPNQSEVLLVLGQYAPISLKALGELIICEEKSPSRLVQSLIRKGFICKEVSKDDKRSTLLSLTSAGRDLLPQIEEQEALFDHLLMEKISHLELFSDSLKEFVAGSFYEDKLKRRSLWDSEE